MNKQEITDGLYEALNGLSIGWQMANVKDNTKRNELQAPINAANEAVLSLLAHFEGKAA